MLEYLLWLRDNFPGAKWSLNCGQTFIQYFEHIKSEHEHEHEVCAPVIERCKFLLA